MSRWAAFLILFELPQSSLDAQRLTDFSTPLPTRSGDTIVIGFLGAFDQWNDPRRGVRKVALDLRSVPGVYAETIANCHRGLAREFIRRALDWNGNGRLDTDESSDARIILYGQSLGANCAIDLARELNRMRVPVLLTVQVDDGGLHGGTIPPNVVAAANFYQHEPFSIWGRQTIHAEDPARTKIVGNFQFHYSGQDVDASSASWARRHLGRGHSKMELDPAVWQQVEALILQHCRKP